MKSSILVLIYCLVGGLVTCNNSDEKPGSPDTIKVHVVPHTHNDVGKLKTVDQYYFGTRSGLYQGGVQFIIDTVVDELTADPSKTFIYMEIAYFKRWWEHRDKVWHNKVRKLIKNKQLEFVGGGYSMNDEASVHYMATVDQFSAGMVWLTENFGGAAEPTVAWQIDTYGHSAAQAALSAQSGLKGLFFSRMHYQEYEKRKQDKELEFNWHSTAGEDTIFSSVLYQGYNAPTGFCFDSTCTDPPIVADPESPEYNLPERLTKFLEFLKEQAAHYRSGNIMLTMGGDFSYQNAHQYFANLDTLMKYVNLNSTEYGFEMVYSTPSRYMNAVKGAIGDSLAQRKEDFFPYADESHSYWSGYYTSRPSLKGYVRDCNNVLQVCRQVEVLVGSPYCDADKLWLAMSVAQHHDAITGTSKKHVADDYFRRLAEGQTFCEGVINRGLEKLSGVGSGSLESCRLANESYCEVTSRAGNKSLTVVVYNARSVNRTEYIRIPLLSEKYELIDLTTNQHVQLTFVELNPALNRVNSEALPVEGVFKATLPALGYSTYRLQHALKPRHSQLLSSQPRDVSADITVQTQLYTVVFDGQTGSLKSVTNKVSGSTDKLSAKFLEYRSNTGDSLSKQASGAHIFRPVDNKAEEIGTPVLTNYISNNQFTEIWQIYGDWINLVTRVSIDKPYIEVEWVVGPLPSDHGREVILRYQTSLSTNQKFYTDSNGREMLQRRLNKLQEDEVTEPVSGNYYPVTTRAVLLDEQTGMQLTVLTDRAQGGASLAEGQVELMVHRRTLEDDNRGVDEALDDELVVKGRHWLYYSRFDSMKENRVLGQEMFYKPTVAIGIDENPEQPSQSYSDSAVENEYINVATIINVDYSGDVFTYLMRLENIIPKMEGGEPITVDLGRVFKGKTLVEFEEKGLAGDRPIENVVDDMSKYTMYDEGNMITLQPLQIRTFFATYKPSSGETGVADRIKKVICTYFLEC
ncbi:lysosomal alpha-mannosidase-like [Bolinopsis microptera]|uniref:lysosomal alpha-mannosidase-like n=1 Tax=Bolinopsis microptera TaxID=2820187 RepID=UPI00307A5532